MDVAIQYGIGRLRRDDLEPDPLRQFIKWYDQAVTTAPKDPNAMTLTTSTRDGYPSARIVLLKEVDERGFIFYTNYESRKGREIAENPHVALVFFWSELERQVRITGNAEKLSRAESATYFSTRPRESRLGAWVSQQSRVIVSREILEREMSEVEAQYPDDEIPLPPFWGGYVVDPATIEFWQGRPSRLHDRFLYTRQADNRWLIERLSP